MVDRKLSKCISLSLRKIERHFERRNLQNYETSKLDITEKPIKGILVLFLPRLNCLLSSDTAFISYAYNHNEVVNTALKCDQNNKNSARHV